MRISPKHVNIRAIVLMVLILNIIPTTACSEWEPDLYIPESTEKPDDGKKTLAVTRVTKVARTTGYPKSG